MGKILLRFILFLLLVNVSYAKDSSIEYYGDNIQIALPTLAYATTLYLEDKQGEVEFYKSFFTTFGTTQILKYSVTEERPNETDTKSFPSGHTSASFQAASFIHFRYGLKYAILPYIGAAFVGYSRVYADKHYTHDVVAGALIGIGFSYYFTTPYKYKSLSITPIVYSDTTAKTQLYGISIRY